jgi:hypothetical protein
MSSSVASHVQLGEPGALQSPSTLNTTFVGGLPTPLSSKKAGPNNGLDIDPIPFTLGKRKVNRLVDILTLGAPDSSQ